MPFRIGLEDPDYARSRHPRFRVPTRGVRAEADADGWWDDLLAVALVLPEAAVFSHTTAAHIAGVPLPIRDPRPFHVTVQRSRGSRRAVMWHERDLADAVEIWKGFPITTPLRTWQDLGSLLAVRELVVAADHLLHRSMTTSDALREVPRTLGAGRLREAAALADGRSRSPRESELRLEMHDRGFPEPELNMDIIEEGGWIGEGDFVWPHYRTIADYDGDYHRDEKQHTQDNQTRDLYAAYGWRHVPITKRMLWNMDAAMERIACALRDRGWRSV